MGKQFKWAKSNLGEYPPESQVAGQNSRIAIVQTFNGTFGTDTEDRQAWRQIGMRLNILPLPRKLHDLRQVLYTIWCDSHTDLEAIARYVDVCQPLRYARC
jgi:hypothetical protein